MRRQTWNDPISIENPETGLVRRIKTVRAAKTMLDRFWPSYHGSQYRRAEEACGDSLSGKVDAVSARKAFIAAVVEAHFHIHQ
jgi:hypothetical protein